MVDDILKVSLGGFLAVVGSIVSHWLISRRGRSERRRARLEERVETVRYYLRKALMILSLYGIGEPEFWGEYDVPFPIDTRRELQERFAQLDTHPASGLGIHLLLRDEGLVDEFVALQYAIRHTRATTLAVGDEEANRAGHDALERIKNFDARLEQLLDQA